MQTKKFRLGDKVKWVSQANAGWLKKVGIVVEVVPEYKFPQHPHGCGGYRRVESYVVEVPGKTPKAKPKLYWPVPSLLQKAGNEALGAKRK
jgi:hypothetical protein